MVKITAGIAKTFISLNNIFNIVHDFISSIRMNFSTNNSDIKAFRQKSASF